MFTPMCVPAGVCDGAAVGVGEECDDEGLNSDGNLDMSRVACDAW